MNQLPKSESSKSFYAAMARRRVSWILILSACFFTARGQSTESATAGAERHFRWVLEVENPKETGAGIKQFIFATSLELRQNGELIQKCKVSGDHVIEFTLTEAQAALGSVDLAGACRRCCQDRGVFTFDQKGVSLRHRRARVGLRLIWSNNI